MSDATLQLRVADTHWQRMRGLLGYAPLKVDQGLLIKPCNMIHTVGMRYPIDVVYVDARGRVLKIAKDVAPLRMSACLRAHAVLELAAGQAQAFGLRVGQTLPAAWWPGKADVQ